MQGLQGFQGRGLVWVKAFRSWGSAFVAWVKELGTGMRARTVDQEPTSWCPESLTKVPQKRYLYQSLGPLLNGALVTLGEPLLKLEADLAKSKTLKR